MTLDREVAAIFGEPYTAGKEQRLTPVSSFRPIVRNEKREIGLTVTTVGELLNEPGEPVRWLVDGLLPHGGLSILAGKPKAGKSTLARCMALAVARGDRIIGRETQGGPVIYLGLEDKRAEVAEHFRTMGAHDEPLYVHTGPAPAQSATAAAQLGNIIADRGATLAIIDTMLRFVRVRDVADYATMTTAMDPLLNLSRDTGCHILAVYHAPKVSREGLDAILGSVAIAGTCDTGLVLGRKADGTRTMLAIQRYGTDLPETVLTLDESTRTVMVGGAVVDCGRRQLELAILVATADKSLTEQQIRDAVGGNTGLAGKVLRELYGSKRLSRTGNGKRGAPYQYSAAAMLSGES